jgi:hypothetical protein
MTSGWTSEKTLSQRRPFLGTDSKETSISRFLGNLPCCLGSEPQRARHMIAIVTRLPRLHSHLSDAPQYIKKVGQYCFRYINIIRYFVFFVSTGSTF